MMDGAFAWLNKFFEYLWAWIPKPYLVSYTHRGVRYRRGGAPTLVKPGWHWYWPMTTSVVIINITDRYQEFMPTDLITSDGKTVSIGFTLMYQVQDPVAAHSRVDNYEQTIGELAETVMTPFVLNHTFAQLITAIADTRSGNSLNKKISQVTRRLLKPYGIKIGYCRIHTITPVRVFRLNNTQR